MNAVDVLQPYALAVGQATGAYDIICLYLGLGKQSNKEMGDTVTTPYMP